MDVKIACLNALIDDKCILLPVTTMKTCIANKKKSYYFDLNKVGRIGMSY